MCTHSSQRLRNSESLLAGFYVAVLLVRQANRVLYLCCQNWEETLLVPWGHTTPSVTLSLKMLL